MSENKDEKDPSETEPSPSDAAPPDPSLPESNIPESQVIKTEEPDVEDTTNTEDKIVAELNKTGGTAEDETTETYTVDDAVNLAGYGKFQKFLTFLAGLGWFADAFEVIILSLIGDMLACEWTYMQRWQNAVMTSVVFCGMTIGAPVFGIFADKYGRRTSLAISMLSLFIFGAASAASPSYPWIVVLRGIMGFALGGIAQGVTLCCEYYPAKMRGRAGFYLSYYWAVGTLGVVGAAWLIMKVTDNWRYFVFVAAVPALIVFLTMKWYPESARYYIVSNQTEKAEKTLKRMAKMNNAELPKGKLVEMEKSEERGNILDLLKPDMRRRTLLFWYIWLAIACAYYGIALITPNIISKGSLPEAAKEHENTTIAQDFRSKLECVKYTNEQFGQLMWTSAAEFPGLIIFTFAVEHCSRRVFLGSSCILLAFLILFLMLKMEPYIAVLILLFVCRGLVAAVFQLLFIMTTEAFPTTLRASAMGTGSGCARIGGLLIPYLAQVAVLSKPIPSIFVLSIVTALAGVASFLLPVETRGRQMQDVIYKEVSSEEVNVGSSSKA